MNEKMKLIARRIKELRDILGISIEDISKNTGIDIDEYVKYENGLVDMPVSVLYLLASEFEVDPTELLTGKSPKMNTYTVIRGEKGVNINRYAGYSFTSLATNYINRDMEPMIVYVEKGKSKHQLIVHAGQEFNYCLEGTIEVTVGDKTFELNEKDSIYFDASIPHSQIAVTQKARFLTVINEYGVNKTMYKKI